MRDQLMGSLATCPMLLRDEFAHQCLLFIFSDLAIRSSGSFKLRFTLFNLDKYQLLNQLKDIADCASYHI